MPRNTFDGAIMSYSTGVSPYYPNNPNFDHFVFQQQIADPSDPDNTYTLCAYAVFTAASGLSPALITLQANLNGKGYKAPKGIQFANMRLYPAGLAILYPSLPLWTPDITLTPVGAYNGSDYVAYNASTPASGNVGNNNNVPINPSPPDNG